MFPTTDKPIGYILKRYPRLSETFILNEIRALERLGTRLTLFSLLRPEETYYHPAINEVRSSVHYLPENLWQKMLTVGRAHFAVATSSPLRYLHALGLATWWSIRTRHPISVSKQFLRAGFVAQGCREQGIRHLHAHFANAPSTVARLASVMCNIPYSFTTHAKDLYLSAPLALSRRVKSASFVLTCTQHNVDYLRGFLPPEDWNKVHLVYHGIDLSAFPSNTLHETRDESDANSLPLILSVGRLVPKKGMNDLLDACRLLRDRSVPFRCIIVGEGPQRSEIEQRINKLGLGCQVSLPGAMAHDRLIRFYGKATLFTLACHVTQDGDRDGIPNVLVEAMASGLAVVSTDVSGIPELIEDGRNGILAPSRNPAALADALQRLLEHHETRQRIAEAGRRSLGRRFECWETAKEVQSLLMASVAS